MTNINPASGNAFGLPNLSRQEAPDRGGGINRRSMLNIALAATGAAALGSTAIAKGVPTVYPPPHARRGVHTVDALNPVEGVAIADTPVMRAFRKRQAYFEWLETASKSAAMSDDDMEAAVNVLTDMEDAMMLIPSESAQDFIAKVVAYTHDGNSALPCTLAMPELWAEAKRFAGGVA